MAIKNRVRELRAVLGKGEISQKQLAERAGIDPSTLSDIENNRTNPNAETCLAIARVLGVTMDDLFLPVGTDGLSVDPEDHVGGHGASAVPTARPSTALTSTPADRTAGEEAVGK